MLVTESAAAVGCPVAFTVQVLDAVGGVAGIHVFLDPVLFGLFGLPTEPGS